jgi:hypothetical protein
LKFSALEDDSLPISQVSPPARFVQHSNVLLHLNSDEKIKSLKKPPPSQSSTPDVNELRSQKRPKTDNQEEEPLLRSPKKQPSQSNPRNSFEFEPPQGKITSLSLLIFQQKSLSKKLTVTSSHNIFFST